MRSLWYWRLWACPRIAQGAACLVTLGFIPSKMPLIKTWRTYIISPPYKELSQHN